MANFDDNHLHNKKQAAQRKNGKYARPVHGRTRPLAATFRTSIRDEPVRIRYDETSSCDSTAEYETCHRIVSIKNEATVPLHFGNTPSYHQVQPPTPSQVQNTPCYAAWKMRRAQASGLLPGKLGDSSDAGQVQQLPNSRPDRNKTRSGRQKYQDSPKNKAKVGLSVDYTVITQLPPSNLESTTMADASAESVNQNDTEVRTKAGTNGNVYVLEKHNEDAESVGSITDLIGSVSEETTTDDEEIELDDLSSDGTIEYLYTGNTPRIPQLLIDTENYNHEMTKAPDLNLLRPINSLNIHQCPFYDNAQVDCKYGESDTY